MDCRPFNPIRALVLAIASTALPACNSDTSSTRGIAEVAQALTAEQARVLSFEAPTTDWQSSAGTLGASSVASDGASSLAVTPAGWTEITSVKLASLGPVGGELRYDIRMPAVPSWGETRAVLVAPSLGLHWYEVGSRPLGSLPANAFVTVSFPLAASVSSALSGSYQDLRVKLVVNAPALGAPYLIDRLSFAEESEPPEPRQISIVVPSGVELANTFVSATDRLSLFSQARVGEQGAPPADLPAVASFGAAVTSLQADAMLFANLFSTAGVQLDARTVVGGSIVSGGPVLKQSPGTPDAPVVVGDEIAETPASASRSWKVHWPAQVGPDVRLWAVPQHLAPRVTTLSPGAYGLLDVHARNRVMLGSGTYFFASFNTEPQAEIHVDKSAGPVVIYVGGGVGSGLSAKGEFVDGGGPEGDLLLTYLGAGTALLKEKFLGTLVAPGATVRLERPQAGAHAGAFFGKGVEVAGPQTVRHVPFRWDSVLCALGDGDDDCGEAGAGTVSGIVLSPAGTPVAGALVDVRGVMVTTGADGRFTSPAVPAGEVTLLASAGGEQALRGTARVEISAHQSASVVLPLAPIGDEPPYLWALYAHEFGSDSEPKSFALRQTVNLLGFSSGVFRDSLSRARHAGVEDIGDELTRPAVTTHGTSQWAAWTDGDSVYVKSIDWGPGLRKTVYTGASGVTAPAIASLEAPGQEPRLVVIWGEGQSLKLSHSVLGAEWTAPVNSTLPTPAVAPALVAHGGELWGAFTSGSSIRTIRIGPDLTWGQQAEVLELDAPAELAPEVTLASNGQRLSLAYAETATPTTSILKTFRIVHRDGSGTWSEPYTIQSAVNGRAPAPPALAYFGGYLYAAFFLSPLHISVKRSPDGEEWAVLLFSVEASSSGGAIPALVPSRYPATPADPEVAMLLDSGRPAADALNFVILPEGFDEASMDEFRALAQQTADTFRTLNPFSKHTDKLNVVRIDLLSREQGVDASPALARAELGRHQPDSPCEALRDRSLPGFGARYVDTALGAHYQGCWKGPGHGNPRCDPGEEPENSHTDLGCDGAKLLRVVPGAAEAAAERWLPGFKRDRDIAYVIVNQAEGDGSYAKDSSFPIVTAPDFAGSFAWMHELGHKRLHLGDEEYENVCPAGISPCTAAHEYPNKTLNADLTDPAHKWAHFFVHQAPTTDPGDVRGVSLLANPLERPPTTSLAAPYWDTSVVNGNRIFNAGLWATFGITNWSGENEQGSVSYGPAPQCLMNHSGGISRFCPVCTEVAARWIHESAGLSAFDDEAYHNDYDRVFVEYVNWSKGKNAPQPEPPPTDGLLLLNGTLVDSGATTCTLVGGGGEQRCSVDVTPWVLSGTNVLTFQAFGRNPSNSGQLDLLNVQVLNSNGAPLPLLPQSDLSTIGNASYLTNYFWRFDRGDLTFQFEAAPSPP